MTKTLGSLVLNLPNGLTQEFALTPGTITLGRAPYSDIVLGGADASRIHARIECSASGCVLTDAGSTNGTRINGERVDRAALGPGDTVEIGRYKLRFQVAGPSREPERMLIDTVADLDATLAHSTLSMTLNDTSATRLAIHVPGRTWEVPLVQDGLLIGRQAGSDIVLDLPKVSRHHARIENRGRTFVIRDLGSTNGVWLGGQRIEEYTLQDGDTVRIGSAQLVFKNGFRTEDLTLVDARIPSSTQPRVPVVVVPGFMGSELWRGSERLWPNPRAIVTHPEIFRLSDDDRVTVRGLANEMVIVPNLIKQEQYGRLGDYLVEALGYERGKDLLEFGYDWRQDLRQSARKLGETIESWQARDGETQGPVSIVAHSMGCLVARYYVERLGGKARVGRLILIGGPHEGAPRTLEAFAFGQQPFLVGRLAAAFQRIMVSFPSVYTILPTSASVFDAGGRPLDPYGDESWALAECRAHIANARAFRQELGTRSSVPAVCVFGYGQKTSVRVQVEETASGRWDKIRFTREDRGDGMVPEENALLEGAEIHPVLQQHGSLYVDSDVKMRLKLELTRR
ncbi:FHA domain-containing protein [Chloroflexota bacterium]